MLLLAVGCCRWLPLLSCLSRRRCRRRCLLLLSPLAAPLCLLLLAPSWLPSLPGCSSLASPVPGLLFCFPGLPRVVPCPRSRRLRRSRRPPGLSWVLGGLWALVCFLLFGLWGWWWFFPVLALSAVPSSGALGSPLFWPPTRRFRISGFPSFLHVFQLASHAPFPDFRISVLFRFHVAIGVPRCSRCSALRARWPSRFRR